MKKILTILALASALFLTACGPSYDYSSKDVCEKSFYAQGEKEGFSEDETDDIVENYMKKVSTENSEEIKKLSEGRTLKSKADLDAFSLEIMEKYVDGKTLKEMKEYVEKK